jgi:hypothetical protein
LDLLTVRDAFVIVVRVVAEAYIFEADKKRTLSPLADDSRVMGSRAITTRDSSGKNRVQTAWIADPLASPVTANLLKDFPLSERKRFHRASGDSFAHLPRRCAAARLAVRGLTTYSVIEGKRS